MERLTRVIKGYGKDVVVYTKGKYEDTTAGEMEVKDVRNVMEKLSDYENTGLTPEQIRELLERDTAKAVDNRTIIQNFSGAPLTIMGDCPSCGCENIKSCNADFCPACGQRLKWEE